MHKLEKILCFLVIARYMGIWGFVMVSRQNNNKILSVKVKIWEHLANF